MREEPIIEMPLKVFELEDPDRVERWLDKKINSMTSPQRQQFFELSDCRFEDKTPLGIFYTNCMSFVNDSAALFPRMARTNHSCAPNTEFITNERLHTQDLIAVRPIKAGEEITLSYLPANGEGSDVATKRRDYLKEYYGFYCICQACTSCSHNDTRSKIRALQLKSSANGLKCGLSLYEMEELADSLERIGSKVHHCEEMFRSLFDRAVAANDRALVFKCFSSVYLYKSIMSCPQIDDWKTNFIRSKCVQIDGKDYLFPPDY